MMRNVTDFHTHILQQVDDGSKSIETSLNMLREEYNQGIEKVVLTPHFYPNHDSPQRFIERRNKAEIKLREEMAKNKELPEIRFGAEVYFFDGISDCEFISQLSIEGGKSIMVEMPMRRWSDRIICELDGIRQKQSLTPIIAHIDRYVELLDKSVFLKLSEMGVLIQANAEFFISRKTRKNALNMLSRGDIHLLGSDCHDMSERKPNLKEALDIIIANLGEEAVEFINGCELSV